MSGVVGEEPVLREGHGQERCRNHLPPRVSEQHEHHPPGGEQEQVRDNAGRVEGGPTLQQTRATYLVQQFRIVTAAAIRATADIIDDQGDSAHRALPANRDHQPPGSRATATPSVPGQPGSASRPPELTLQGGEPTNAEHLPTAPLPAGRTPAPSGPDRAGPTRAVRE